MRYRTLEVDMDRRRALPKGAQALPEKASGLLTILLPPPLPHLRPKRGAPPPNHAEKKHQ
jgi:hypothetical protein